MFDRLVAIGLILACGALAVVIYHHDQTILRIPRPGKPALANKSDDVSDPEALLDRKIPAVEFDEMPVHSAFLRIGELSHANIAVRWDSLAYAKLAYDRRISLRLENVTLRHALAALIDELQRETNEQLAFAIINGVITISTYGDFDPHPVHAAYNIRDLIARLEKHGQSPVQAADHVVRLISNSVAPTTWRDNGGNRTINEYAGLLLVTQTVEHQAEVEEFLGHLRRPEGQKLLNSPSTEPAER